MTGMIWIAGVVLAIVIVWWLGRGLEWLLLGRFDERDREHQG